MTDLTIDIEQADQSPTAQLIYKTIPISKLTTWLQNTVNQLNSSVSLEILKLFSHFYVAIFFVESAQSQALNYQYRQKNNPTNILSFPSAIPLDFYQALPKEEQQYTLGDLVVDLSVIKKEAEEQHKKLEHHLAHILIHGLLHLFKFDHETLDEAEIMESLEIELLKNLGIPNPYESD
jgi:probable rRNA maturation factor